MFSKSALGLYKICINQNKSQTRALKEPKLGLVKLKCKTVA